MSCVCQKSNIPADRKVRATAADIPLTKFINTWFVLFWLKFQRLVVKYQKNLTQQPFTAHSTNQRNTWMNNYWQDHSFEGKWFDWTWCENMNLNPMRLTHLLLRGPPTLTFRKFWAKLPMFISEWCSSELVSQKTRVMRYVISHLASAWVCFQDCEWAKPENRKEFTGGGQIADNRSSLLHKKLVIMTFTSWLILKVVSILICIY